VIGQTGVTDFSHSWVNQAVTILQSRMNGLIPLRRFLLRLSETLLAKCQKPDFGDITLIWGDASVVALAISTDFQPEFRALLNGQYCGPSEHQGWASGPHVEKTVILENLDASVRLDFSLLDGGQATCGHSISPSGELERGRHSQEGSGGVHQWHFGL
jgi:hypothetical protein